MCWSAGLIWLVAVQRLSRSAPKGFVSGWWLRKYPQYNSCLSRVCNYVDIKWKHACHHCLLWRWITRLALACPCPTVQVLHCPHGWVPPLSFHLHQVIHQHLDNWLLTFVNCCRIIHIHVGMHIRIDYFPHPYWESWELSPKKIQHSVVI